MLSSTVYEQSITCCGIAITKLHVCGIDQASCHSDGLSSCLKNEYHTDHGG
uniref:Uncharacterized protein n=1 Tax=Anguilla anguilla TaxID=7936 RepID=A0A0E9RWV8_ANGAN